MDGLTPGVPPAGGTGVMRALQLVTVLALDEGRRADRQVCATLSLPSLRDLSLGNAHA